MKPRLCVMWIAFAFLAALNAYRADAADKDEKKGTVVDLGGLKSTTPATWKDEKPSSKMRLQQFVVPKAEGDDNDAEISIFNLGGSNKENIERWKNQFTPPEGKKADDVFKVTDMKVGESEVTYVDLQGTYRSPPFDPKYKGAKKANYRMLGILFTTKNGNYQIRCIGPAKTIEKNKKGFDDWIKAFK